MEKRVKSLRQGAPLEENADIGAMTMANAVIEPPSKSQIQTELKKGEKKTIQNNAITWKKKKTICT